MGSGSIDGAYPPQRRARNNTILYEVPPGSSHWGLITGRTVLIPGDRIVEVTEEEAVSMTQNGCKRVD